MKPLLPPYIFNAHSGSASSSCPSWFEVVVAKYTGEIAGTFLFHRSDLSPGDPWGQSIRRVTLRKARPAWESRGDGPQTAEDGQHGLLVGGGSLVRVPGDRLRRGRRHRVLNQGNSVVRMTPVGEQAKTGLSDFDNKPVEVFYGKGGPEPLYQRDHMLDGPIPKPTPLHMDDGSLDFWCLR